MYKYVFKRLLLIIPIMLGVTFIVFFIMNITPGDVASMILGPEAPLEARKELTKELGLDKPFIERYINYIFNAIKGDFGKSYRTGRDVFVEIFYRFPTTLKLAIAGIATAMILGISIGVFSAVRQYSVLDIISTVLAMLMACIPVFWLGLMMILLFSLKLGWLPSNGIGSMAHFIMPTISVAVPAAAEIMRLTRSSMLETIRQEYIVTARAKGAPEKTIILKHALKNALLPVITAGGINFGMLLGGTVIAEAVYVLPGVGTLMINAIRAKDTPQVMASVLWLSFIFCLVMLMVDLLYAYIDPRIKAKYIQN